MELEPSSLGGRGRHHRPAHNNSYMSRDINSLHKKPVTDSSYIQMLLRPNYEIKTTQNRQSKDPYQQTTRVQVKNTNPSLFPDCGNLSVSQSTDIQRKALSHLRAQHCRGSTERARINYLTIQLTNYTVCTVQQGCVLVQVLHFPRSPAGMN